MTLEAILFSAFGLIGAFIAGGNATLILSGNAKPANGAALVTGAVMGVYFMARSHGWI